MQITIRVFNNEVVQEHSLYNAWHSTLDEISFRDYHGNYPFRPGICCLDMDAYAHNGYPSKQPPSTVDAVIGCSEYSNKQSRNPGLLLVELRMGYQSVSNVSINDLEEKDKQTRLILGTEKNVKPETIFIFKKELVASLESRFQREKRIRSFLKNYIPCSVAQFHEWIKSVDDDFPYYPIHSREEIEGSFLRCRQERNEDLLCSQFKYWVDLISDYELRYNRLEKEHIVTVLQNIWPSMKQELLQGASEEMCLAIEIIEEDYLYIFNSIGNQSQT